MAVTVRIPTTLRPLSGGAKQVELESGSLAEVIAALDATHPGFRDRLLDDNGGLRKFVNVFVDDDDVRYLDGLDTKVADGITVSIIPAVAGGGTTPSCLLRTQPRAVRSRQKRSLFDG